MPCQFSSANVVAGDEQLVGTADGQGTAAQFGYISALRTDPSNGDILVQGAGAIRRLTPAGQVSTVVSGISLAGYASFGVTNGGRIYYVGADGLHRVEPGGGDTLIPITPPLASCDAFTALADGSYGVAVYALGSAGAGVSHINLTTGARTQTAVLSDVATPTDVAVDIYGRVFLADPDHARTRVVANGSIFGASPAHLAGMTWSVATTPWGEVFTTSAAHDALYPGIVRRYPWFSPGVAVGRDQNVYVPHGRETADGWTFTIHAFPPTCGR